MSKTTSHGSTTKNSPAMTMSSNRSGAPKSSILKSAFAPSHLQLALFASVIQGLDSQQLRVHDTHTGRLRCQHAAGAGNRITSLDWGFYGSSYRQWRNSDKKKRKRTENKTAGAVVAYGTSNSDICIFSPSEAKIVGKLTGGHERDVKDFKFCPDDYSTGWSVGGEGKLVQWDLSTGQVTRSINIQDPSVNVLASPSSNVPQLLCASSTPSSVELLSSDGFRKDTFDSHRQPIHSLFRSGSDETNRNETFLAVDSDRFVNISDLSTKKLLRTLVTSGEVQSASFFTPDPDTKNALSQQILAVLRKDGVIEMFARPFSEAAEPLVNGDITSKRKNLTRKATAIVRIISSEARAPLSICNASLQGADLLAAITEGGINVSFQRIRWQDEGTGDLLFEGTKDILHIRPVSTLNSIATNGVKDMSGAHLDESTAVVLETGQEGSSHKAAIAILSSDGESSSDDDEEVDSDEDQKEITRGTPGIEMAASSEGGSGDESELAGEKESGKLVVKAQGALAERQDETMHDAEAADAGDEEEPTFGEIAAAQHGAIISVVDSLPTGGPTTVVQTIKGAPIPAGMSLTTVLSQSLRTNDTNLLESCLHTTSTDIIRATIQRLDSSLAGILLQRLAERLSSRPGRYGHLITWVQSTCIIHGGSLASQPAAVEKMRTLYKVLNQRSRCLGDLLVLKGKLDMLDQQLQYRKFLAAQRSQTRPHDDSGVIMIEGQDNWSSTDEDEGSGAAKLYAHKKKKPRRDLNDLISHPSSDDDMDEDVHISDEDEEVPSALPNGIEHSSDEEDEDSEDDHDMQDQPGGGLIDSEAEVSDDLDEEDDDESASTDEEDADEEVEPDSEMDSFINDDEIPEEPHKEDELDIDVDETPEKPPSKKPRRR